LFNTGAAKSFAFLKGAAAVLTTGDTALATISEVAALTIGSTTAPAALEPNPPSCIAFLATGPASFGIPTPIAPKVGIASAPNKAFCFNKTFAFSAEDSLSYSGPEVIGASYKPNACNNVSSRDVDTKGSDKAAGTPISDILLIVG